MSRAQTTLDFAIGVSVFLVVVAFVLAFVPGMVQPFQASTQQETAAADRIAEQLAAGMLAEDPATPYVLDRECTVIFFESRQDGNDPAGDDAENVDGNNDGFTDPFGSGTFAGSCNFPDSPVDRRLAVAGSDLDFRISLVADLTTEEADNPRSPVGGDGDMANFGEPGDDGVDQDDQEVEPICIERNGPDDVLGTDDDYRFIEGDEPFAGGAQCDVSGGDDDVLLSIGGQPPSSTSSVVVARRFVRFEGGFADGTDEATLLVEVW